MEIIPDVKCSNCKCLQNIEEFMILNKKYKTCYKCRNKKNGNVNTENNKKNGNVNTEITNDRQFNLYYEYSVTNSILNKQKLRPFTIWIYKMRDVVNTLVIQYQIKIIINRFKKVLNELIHYCAYPRWKYLFNFCVWEIEDKYNIVN